MYKKTIILFLGIIFCSILHAQQKDLVLLTIDNSPVYTSEFKRVYLKNIDLVKDEKQKNVDEYLELFIKYKLKLAEAQKLGLDKKESYLNEFEGYKKQLSSGYLTDTKVSESLIKEGYDRLQERIHGSHILVMLKPNASAKDTLLAYNKIVEARNKIIEGADFTEIAKEYSEDPSVKNNGGDLGWFSAFRMVYPFEDAAYTTNVGDVSKPFKTRFGYHIVKVNKREKTLGEITVAHIMVAFTPERTEEQAEERITEINKQLQQNVSFESLAKQFSDDTNTAVNGGKINRFAQGHINSEDFEKVAFGLKTPGEISSPVKSKYGWHIVKLIEKFPSKTFEESKAELTEKIKRDDRSQLITKSFINSLKEKYGLKRNKEAISYFKKNVPETIFKENWEIPSNDKTLEKEIMAIGQDSFSFMDFATYINNSNQKSNYTDVSIFLEKMYTDFESKNLLEYYEEHLEEDNQDFANIVAEYRDGLLLFDLMETKVWNASKTDSIGLKKFYDSRKENYVKQESYKVLKASSSQQSLIDKVKTLVISGKSVDEIKKEVNVSDEQVVLFSEQELVKGEDPITDSFSKEIDQIHVFNYDDYITLIKVNEVLPSRLKTFEEIKGKVINDYQEDLEKKWLESLRKKYSIEVNKKTLKKIKKQLTIL